MKNYTIGDSHADYSFRGIIEDRVNIGAKTMHGVRKDKIDFNKILNERFNNINYDSFVIFCFGEIDMRCHIYNHIKEGSKESDVIEELVNDFVNHIKEQKKFFNRIGILSITPPASSSWTAPNYEYPFRGTDQDRARYTIVANSFLKEACLKNNIDFIDVYNYYSDENGILLKHFSDGSVHIGNTIYVLEELRRHIIL